MNNHLIAEQVYDGHSCSFAVYDFTKGDVSYSPELWVGGSCYKPLVGEEIHKKAVLLPSEAEEYGSDEQLDADLKSFITKWLDISPEFLNFCVWNIKRSWVYDRFNTLNYLRFMGDTGQGKTRGLDTIGSIHYKPIMTSGATTAAPVFRVINKWRGTMVFDECDLKITEETADIIKIINMGYEKGKNVMRCDQNDATKIMFFDPYCPKVLATRKPFEDKAVESRCFTEVMTGTRRKDIAFNLNDKFFDEAQILRNKLLMWRFRNFFVIDPSFKPNVDFSHLEPRVQQIFTSFMALFGKDEAQMAKFKSFVEEYQEELIDERQNSWEGQIVVAIHDLIEKGQSEISAQDIIQEGGITNDRGIQLKPRALTNVLRELGFGKSRSIRIEGKIKRCIPLAQDLLNHLFARYGVTIVTVVRRLDLHQFIYENKFGDPEKQGRGGSPGAIVTSLQEEEIEVDKSVVTVQNANRNDRYNRNRDTNRNDRYNRNEPEPFDEKIQSHIPCMYPTGGDEICCDEPTNEWDGHYYCAKHFTEAQA